jgi:hypothetical protein
MQRIAALFALLLPIAFVWAQEGKSKENVPQTVVENEFVRVSKVDFRLDLKQLTSPPKEVSPQRPNSFPVLQVWLRQTSLAERVANGGDPAVFKFYDVSYSAAMDGSVGIPMCDEGLFRLITVELKQAPPIGPFEKDAVKLDPKHNKVLFENDRVRIVHLLFPPGEEGPVVDKRPRVIILLTDTHAQVRTQDGKLSPRDSTAGTIQWSLGGRQATINGMAGPLENIVVELKSADAKGK